VQSEAAAAHDDFSDFSFVNVGKVASALPQHLSNLFRSLTSSGGNAAQPAAEEDDELAEFDDDGSYIDDDEVDGGVDGSDGAVAPSLPSTAPSAGGDGSAAAAAADSGSAQPSTAAASDSRSKTPATHMEVPPRPPLSEDEALALAQHLATLSTSPVPPPAAAPVPSIALSADFAPAQ
jgi:hypothetical protein